MKIAIISGSHRPESQSGRVARYIERRLTSKFSLQETYLLDLGRTALPLWDEDAWKPSEEFVQSWSPVSAELKTAEGFVFVSPEWAGMVPAALKNFFLLCNKGELAHKPALIVAVSASRGGAYPIAELRMSSYKNTYVCYIPDHLIVRDVATAFVGEEPQSKDDERIRARADYAVGVLLAYAKAFGPIRASGVINLAAYPYGM
jgi:NAD(P)H-dependent FMN reductase